jgi:putative IMPACT (imprinted ancient) family translation regulator
LEHKDTYNTIANPSEQILLKEKSSKFFGYAFPIQSEEELKPILDQLKKKHPHAGHFCYAYQIGTEILSYRANDDGEPSNSAGMPIYGQIQSFAVTNAAVVVVRIFGGTKLGVGGLISAYKTAAQMTLEASEII